MRKMLLAFVLLASSAAGAREWFDPAHGGQSYVNHHLTPKRVLKAQAKPAWNRQLVLWEGELTEQKVRDGKRYLKLDHDGVSIPVVCPKPVLTLNVDRTGYRVAVKGEVLLKDGKFQALVGRSIILLTPPKPWNAWAYAGVKDPQARFLSWWIGCHCPHYKPEECIKLGNAIVAQAKKHDLDPLFFAALLQVESAFRTDAVSVSGALGLGQLMPETAQGLGVDPNDPVQNVAGSAKMIKALMDDFSAHSDPRPLVLASYNAGPTLVRSLGSVPRIPQTTNYVYFIGYLHRHLTELSTKVVL